MEKYDIVHYSGCLGRDMRIKVYGHYGAPIIVFPCQNSMSDNFENFGMIDTLSDYIEEGKIRLFCVDSVDMESWSDENGDKVHRAWIQEQYYYYIINEVLPVIYEDCEGYVEPFVMGCSMGANHSVNMFFRRPDLFAGVLAMSGVYDTVYFWGGWCNETLYNNSPERYLENMPTDHPYIDIYNSRKIILCVGQGAWESQGLDTLRHLDWVFHQKNIHAWVDYWGTDVAHDWPWWKKQIRYFLPHLLDENED